MKVLKMREVYRDYMDIHLEIHPPKKKVVFIRGKWYTILPALTLDGFIACDIMKGSCSKERFRTFVLSQVVSICIRVRVTSIFAFIFAFYICITLHKLTFNLGILNFIVAFYESFSW